MLNTTKKIDAIMFKTSKNESKIDKIWNEFFRKFQPLVHRND